MSNRTTQPQFNVRLDLTNPLCRDLRVAWAPSMRKSVAGANRNYVGSLAFESTTHYASRYGKGMAFSLDVGAGVQFGVAQPLRDTKGYTFLAIAAPVASAGQRGGWFSQRLGSGDITQMNFTLNTDQFGNSSGSVGLSFHHGGSTYGLTAGSQMDGLPHIWVAGIGVEAGQQYLLRDGAQQTLSYSQQLDIFQTVSVSTQETCIGNVAATSDTNWPVVDPIYLVLAWDRRLPVAEARRISHNPWQVFLPVVSQWNLSNAPAIPPAAAATLHVMTTGMRW